MSAETDKGGYHQVGEGDHAQGLVTTQPSPCHELPVESGSLPPSTFDDPGSDSEGDGYRGARPHDNEKNANLNNYTLFYIIFSLSIARVVSLQIRLCDLIMLKSMYFDMTSGTFVAQE